MSLSDRRRCQHETVRPCARLDRRCNVNEGIDASRSGRCRVDRRGIFSAMFWILTAAVGSFKGVDSLRHPLWGLPVNERAVWICGGL